MVHVIDPGATADDNENSRLFRQPPPRWLRVVGGGECLDDTQATTRSSSTSHSIYYHSNSEQSTAIVHESWSTKGSSYIYYITVRFPAQQQQR